MKTLFCFLLFLSSSVLAQGIQQKDILLMPNSKSLLSGKKIMYVEREQYIADHHNTATLFQKGEINESSFRGGSALRIFDVDKKATTTLLDLPDGIVRDPELSYDAKKVIFSMRKNKDDYYHIYEIDIDSKNIRQLTFSIGVSDIDPLYMPDGGIVFSSTRQPKYCMCNRHIMANLYRMDSDGANITQIGKSTLFEGHSSMLNDGRILYDRWEYVDRNFGDAQGLWAVNPDGTKHTIYYGNNTASPGAVIDGRAIASSDLIVCVFSSCHDRPWGAVAIIDRRKGVDGADPVVDIWPKNSIKLLNGGNLDSFKNIDNFYEDPYPINENNILASRTIWFKRQWGNVSDSKMGIYLLTRDGSEDLILEGTSSLFDPILVEPRAMPNAIPNNRDYTSKDGIFYVQNVYEGTHVEGIEKGSVKYLRVVESPEKRTWTSGGWFGEGEQAPGMNWHSFENKKILGEVEVESDGSAHFKVPAGKHVYFQLLDKDKKMVQSMRSGTTVMPGEINGCIGCHDNRLNAPVPTSNTPIALKKKSVDMTLWQGQEPFKFSFMEHVQPILDKRCVKCHDFDPKNRDKLVLAGDKNPFFNAAYINLYVKNTIKLVGGGPAAIQQPYSWGSHASKLTKIIDTEHHGVKLTPKEKETLYTWMDLNGVYYPVYESSFDNTMAGRSPLTNEELGKLKELTGVDFWSLNRFSRNVTAQLSFDRPEVSPCLDAIRSDKDKFAQAVEIIKIGSKRLKETPRGDIEKDVVPCERNKKQLEKYAERLEYEIKYNKNIAEGDKMYDK